MKPLVSIITPTYNHERYISKCIESVLAQTFPDWEQIIIDDGSTDSTGEIIRTYTDTRIKYIRQKHVGLERLGQTYNHALKECTAPFVAILEGDDVWPADKLEKQLPSLLKNDAVLSYGITQCIDSRGKLLYNRNDFPKDENILFNRPAGAILKKYLTGIPMYPVSIVLRRQALEQAGGFVPYKNTPTVDFFTVLNLSLQGEFSFVSRVLGYWRLHSSQTTARYCMIGTKDYALEFAKKCVDKGKLDRKILSQLRRRLYFAESYMELLEARRLLKKRSWREARRILFKLTIRGTTKIRLAALLGVIGTFGRFDVERIFSMFGKKKLISQEENESFVEKKSL